MPAAERRVPWNSAITEVETDSLRTHGVDQRDLIRDYSYEETVYFLLLGRRPTSRERDLLRAVLVAHASHGITGQSTLAVIGAADCRSGFLHALIAGFSVGSGVYHQGGLPATMMLLQKLARLSEAELAAYVDERLRIGERIMGFGHRFHARDPRVEALMDFVREHGFEGPHTRVALRLEEILRERKGISMNIEAAGGSILLDLGFDPAIGHLFIVLGRSTMFAAVYLERLAQGRPPFPRIEIMDVLEDEG